MSTAAGIGVVMWKFGEIVAQVGEFRNNFLQLREIGRIEKEIDVGKLLAQPFLLIGDHASGQHDRDLRSLALQPDQRVEFPGNLVLGGLTHDARIQDDDVGVLLVRVAAYPASCKRRGNLRAIGLIHLAANGPDMKALAIGRQWGR